MKIHDVLLTPLRQIQDDRGSVMHMLRATDPHFSGFGEIYFSTVKQGAVKAWKRHRQMTLNLACPVGEVRLVVYDDRESSPTRGIAEELVLGAGNYQLVTIPPLLWTGFTGLSAGPSLVANCASLPHDPVEADRLNAYDPSIPYAWPKSAA
jgi:dTDP-4-dehydrorhamnose 3,5-epimerase